MGNRGRGHGIVVKLEGASGDGDTIGGFLRKYYKIDIHYRGFGDGPCH